jgi:hypothetical protein
MHRRVMTSVAAATLSLVGFSAPVAADTPDAASMAFVGDSIGTQSQEEITAEVATSRPLTGLFVANGATIAWSRADVAEFVQGPQSPSILVVGLGHADVEWAYPWAKHERDLRRFLDATAPYVDCVRWFDVRTKPTRYLNVNRRGARWNALLAEVASDYDNVEVLHYSAWAAAAPDGNWIPDLLHLSPAGEREMGRIVRQAADGCDPTRSSGPFWDVPDSNWAARPVAWLADQGLVDGFPNGTYRAQLARIRFTTTRGQLASVLWRGAGSPAPAATTRWPDVGPGWRSPVNWVTEQRLVAGYPDGRFRPGQPLTRGALLRALWLRAGGPMGAPPAPWTDVPAHLVRAAAWAAENGIVAGFADGTFRPTAPVDRATLAHLLAPLDQRGPFVAPPPEPAAASDPVVVPLDVPGEPILVAPR